MATLPANGCGSLAGTGIVTLVPAPASNQQNVVRGGKICNIDASGVQVNLFIQNGTGLFYIAQTTLQPRDTFILEEEDCDVLDTTSKSLCATMSAAAASLNPTWTSAYATIS